MQAVILAGGFGLRLRGVIADIPKPMADIKGKPFLEYLIIQLKNHSFKDITICTGYKSEVINSYFQEGQRWGLNISYSHEIEPLGTGGALKQALKVVDQDLVLVMNGDSFFSLDFEKLIEFHKIYNPLVTLALKPLKDNSRYGTVKIDQAGLVTGFLNDRHNQDEPINAGVYVVDKKIIDVIPEGKVSLERQIFPKLAGKAIYGRLSNGFFIDIGIPEDYYGLLKSLHLLTDCLDKK